MPGWICKSCGNRIFENEPDEHNEDCEMQVVEAPRAQGVSGFRREEKAAHSTKPHVASPDIATAPTTASPII